MIKLTISQLIVFYTAIPILLLLVLWFLCEKNSIKRLLFQEDIKDFTQTCPFCGNVFIDSKKSVAAKCPQCMNLVKI